MFCRAGEVHLRYLAWWNLFTVLTQTKRKVPLPPPPRGSFCGCGIRTVCSVSCGRTEMTLVKREGNVRLSDPKHFCSWPSGLSRSMPPCLHTFAGMDDAVGCSAAATVFVGTCGTGCYWWGCEWKGREPAGLASRESWDSPCDPCVVGILICLCSRGAVPRVTISPCTFSPAWE